MRALRRLQREQEPKSSFVFTSELGSPFTTAGFARMIARHDGDRPDAEMTLRDRLFHCLTQRLETTNLIETKRDTETKPSITPALPTSDEAIPGFPCTNGAAARATLIRKSVGACGSLITPSKNWSGVIAGSAEAAARAAFLRAVLLLGVPFCRPPRRSPGLEPRAIAIFATFAISLDRVFGIRSLRGSLGVHSRYGLHTRAVTNS